MKPVNMFPVPLGQIHLRRYDLGGRNYRRAAHPTVAREIRLIGESFQKIGQVVPIVVEPREGGGYWVIDGRLRVLAARRIKRYYLMCEEL